MKLISLILFAFLSSSAWAGTYKWTDAEGNVHYGDQPPTDMQTDEIKVPGVAAEPTSPATKTASGQVINEEPRADTDNEATASTETTAQAPEQQDECSLLKNKLKKFEDGLIDFSYEDASGRQVTPAKATVVRAYEKEIDRACNAG